MLFWIGVVLFSFGVGISVAVYAHDLWRAWIARREPQMAPSRLPPELHFIGAVFAGIGAALAWDWKTGLIALVAQAGLGLFLAMVARG